MTCLKTKYLRSLTIALMTACPIKAVAERLDIIAVEFSHIIERKNSRFVNCGIQFTAALKGHDSGAVGINGTWNQYYGNLSNPLLIMKLAYVDIAGKQVAPVKVTNAVFSDLSSDTANFTPIESENGKSYLAATSAFENADLMEAINNAFLQTGVHVFFSTETSGYDLTVKLPPLADREDGIAALEVFRKCNLSALDDMRSALPHIFGEKN